MLTSRLFFIGAACALALSACGKSNSGADAAEISDTQTSAQTQPVTSNPAPGDSAPAATGDSLALAEMSMGDPNAPVKMVEYASLTCPHCATFHATMFPRVKEEYIDTGKVHFTFREFPLQRLDYLVFALSRCAAEGRGADGYFAMLSTLFKNQNTWMSSNRDAEILKYAAQAGLNESAFRSCVSRPEITEKVQASRQAGMDAGVNSTPSFVLNGEKMDRYRSVDEYFEMLDAAVAAASN